MSRTREIRSYDYVNFPYDKVRAALTDDPRALFRAATRSASARAGDVAAALRVNVAGIEIAKEVDITVAGSSERQHPSLHVPVTHFDLEWQAVGSPRLFPLMHAELEVYALSATETQLDFLGRYEPPLGPLGDAIDAVVGHKIAEASVHRLLHDVAGHLRKTLG